MPALLTTIARFSATYRPKQWIARSRRVLAAAVLASLPGLSAGQGMEPVEVTVEWTHERCDFVLTKDAEGYGVVLKLTPVEIAAGDVLVGALSRINYTGRVTKQASGEPVMMRALKYGVRRKEAVRSISEYSRHCKPPAE
jgi:hypothetical protein